MNRRSTAWVATASLTIGLCATAAARPQEKPATSGSVLMRHYHEGERILYQMTATNQNRDRLVRYSATADGMVTKDAAGNFIEVLAWKDLSVNGSPVALPESNLTFRQILALPPSPGTKVPDLSQVYPTLVGPVTDLLTFYADMHVLARGGSVSRPGDHFYYKYGTPASWADGTRVLTGQSSIDFDVTLAELDAADGHAVVLVKHVPPAVPQITLAADWMRPPVADTPNNWTQVSTVGDGRFAAAVGKETFEARIRIGLADGRILSAELDNSVDVLERECTDAALTACGDPARYPIHRHITITAGDAR